MKIISRYVLREHAGPLGFALTALTSLMLLNFVAKQFGELVGKGLPTSVIVEFFLLAIPFTVAMTLPMAVLVAVLYAFSRLASENEVVAFKASGVSMWRLMFPALMMGAGLTLFMIAFNDQVLPRANYALANLQRDIVRTRPTFAIKEQVINTLQEGRFYLRTGTIERGNGNMREVVVYDMTNPERRRTIYADSGRIALAPNLTDVHMTLYHGVMQEVANDAPDQLTRLYYERDRIRIAGVASQYERSEGEVGKGDREMSVCEMQATKRQYELRIAEAYRDSVRIADQQAAARGEAPPQREPVQLPDTSAAARGSGIGGLYCRGVQALGSLLAVREAQASPAQEPAQRPGRDSAIEARHRRARAMGAMNAIQPPAEATPAPTPTPSPASTPPAPAPAAEPQPVPGGVPPGSFSSSSAVFVGETPEMREIQLRDAGRMIEDARSGRDRYEVEIQKKFSLAAACIIFVLVGAPVALRFPRGGVGLVIGVSLVIFAIYYIGLIGGEALADRGFLSPFWAMWSANFLLLALGLVLAARMGHEANTGRGGGALEWLDSVRERWKARKLARARGPVTTIRRAE